LISRETRAQLLSIQRQPPAKFAQAARLVALSIQRELAQMTRRFLVHVLERDVREQTMTLDQKVMPQAS
jgi:hypothetical protein